MIITYLIGVITSIILCSIVLGVIDAIGQDLRKKYSVLWNFEWNFESFEYVGVIACSFLWPIVLPIIIFILFVTIIRIMTSAVILKLFYLKDVSKNKGDDNE